MGALAPITPWKPEDDLLLKNAVEVSGFFFFTHQMFSITYSYLDSICVTRVKYKNYEN